MSAAPSLVADCLINLFGAAGALMLAREARRIDPRGPVTRRIVFALWFVAALFLVRVASWISGDAIADTTAVLMASATPLVSLIVVEGMLRRHAPRPLKTALAAAPVLVTAIALVPFPTTTMANTTLMITVAGGFASIAILLWRRDQTALSSSENAAAAGVLAALLVLAPLIATDFRSLWPDTPVRLGALGALVLLYIGLGSGNHSQALKVRAVNVLVFTAIGAALAVGQSLVVPAFDTADMIRVVATVTAAILFAVLWVQNHHTREEEARALASLLTVATPQAFTRLVTEHPLFGGAHVLSGPTLDHVRHPAFDALFRESPTLRLAAAPWGRSPDNAGVERALSLMSAYDATHLASISLEPMRLIAFSLPPTLGDTRTESLLEVARLVGETVHLKADRT